MEFDTQARDLDGAVTYTAGGIPEPRTGAVRRVVNLPNRVPTMPKEQYVNDSAHHGLSMDQKGTTLCAAGTMDDYAALVDRKTMGYKIFDTASTGHSYGKPYWTTEGLNNTCWISLSEADSVAVLDFGKKKELAYLPVGDHPQRIRHGYLSEQALAAAPSSTAATTKSAFLAAAPLRSTGDTPAPAVTEVQDVDLEFVGQNQLSWVSVAAVAFLLLSSLLVGSVPRLLVAKKAQPTSPSR